VTAEVHAWPEPVERVAGFLRSAGAEARLEELPRGTPTAADAAEAIGCGLDQIVESIVLLADSAPVVALVPGDRRGDAAKVASALGAATARLARPDEVEAATGFPSGAVAPFPLARVSRVLVEQRLLAKPVVWVGAGSARHVVRLAPAELLRLARADPADVVEDAYDASDTDETKEP
jgi:prolyl-tRNA editing enzyme YbaK/EbsC (Cys-tRNA(Pro) deacylase)